MATEGQNKGIFRGRVSPSSRRRTNHDVSAFPVSRAAGIDPDATVVDGQLFDVPEPGYRDPDVMAGPRQVGVDARRGRRRAEISAPLLSFVWPGAGQWHLGLRWWGVLMAVPPLALVLGLLAWAMGSPEFFLLRLLAPGFALGILALIALHGAWRVISIIDAWLKARGRHVPLRRDRALPLVVVLSLVVVLLHGVLASYVASFSVAVQPAFGGFGGTPGALDQGIGANAPDWGSWDRDLPGDIVPGEVLPEEGPLNVLVLGVDWMPGRDSGRTDTIQVASFDPETGRSAQISIPRDTGFFKLRNGTIYQNRINSLLGYFRNRPDQYPDGPIASMAQEVGHLLGVRIHYYAVVNVPAFEQLVDLVGGIDYKLEYPIIDHKHKFYLDAGRHRLNGRQALMVARSRYGPNNNDYQRARRQQDLLRAIADKLRTPAVAIKLPEILGAMSDAARTNLPLDSLSEFVDLLEKTREADPVKVVLSPSKYSERIPMTETGGRWMTRLKMDAVKALSIEAFGRFSRYSRDN